MKHWTKIATTLVTLVIAAALVSPAEAGARNRQPDRQKHRQVQDRHAGQRSHATRNRSPQRFSHRHTHARSRSVDRHRSTHRHRIDTHRRFVAPRHLHAQRLRSYRSYYERDLYFAPHRHRHAIYLFPFRDEYGWSYREYAYCGGELFLDHGGLEYHGRRVSVRVGF